MRPRRAQSQLPWRIVAVPGAATKTAGTKPPRLDGTFSKVRRSRAETIGAWSPHAPLGWRLTPAATS